MDFTGDLLGVLSGMEGGTHPRLLQVVRGIAGDARSTGPGLHWVLGRLREHGHGAVVDAWAAGHTHTPVEPHELHAALGDEEVRRMAQRAGLTPDEFIGKLSQHLPGIVHHLSAEGRAPA